MTLPTAARAALQRVNDPDGLLYLLTITGGGIPEPVRLVNDTRDVVSNGETFLRMPFDVIPPKDAAKEAPRAQLRLDNVGREFMVELEALEPGAELEARLQVVSRADPDTVLYDFAAPLGGVRADAITVTATFGVSELMRRAAVNVRYDPTTAPGLFSD